MSPFGFRALVLLAGSSLLWLHYFWLKDALRPEPRRRVLVAFLLGAPAVALALALYRLAEALGGPSSAPEDPAAAALYCLLMVGPIEEAAKFLAAGAIAFRWRCFDEPVDGIVYAGAVGIGFATVENVLYLPLLQPGQALARCLASPLTHALFASAWGVTAGHASFRVRSRAGRAAWIGGGLAFAMFAHGLYDALLFTSSLPVIASVVVLALWVALIWTTRRSALIRRSA